MSDQKANITKKKFVMLESLECKAGAKKWDRKKCVASMNTVKKPGCKKQYAAVLECTGAKKKPPP